MMGVRQGESFSGRNKGSLGLLIHSFTHSFTDLLTLSLIQIIEISLTRSVIRHCRKRSPPLLASPKRMIFARAALIWLLLAIVCMATTTTTTAHLNVDEFLATRSPYPHSRAEADDEARISRRAPPHCSLLQVHLVRGCSRDPCHSSRQPIHPSMTDCTDSRTDLLTGLRYERI